MNYGNMFRLTQITLIALMLAACNNNDDEVLVEGPNLMTAEKMQLVSTAIQELVDTGYIAAEGSVVVSDQTTISHQVESYTNADETVSVLTALDSIFPYDYMPWSLEESDLAFARYYDQNLEPVNLQVEHLDSLDREAVLLMQEQFDEYFVDDEFAGWDQFYLDYPDAIGYLRVGNPVILETAGIALVHVDIVSGPYFGMGFFAMFRKENDSWKFETWYADWVS